MEASGSGLFQQMTPAAVHTRVHYICMYFIVYKKVTRVDIVKCILVLYVCMSTSPTSNKRSLNGYFTYIHTYIKSVRVKRKNKFHGLPQHE